LKYILPSIAAFVVSITILSLLLRAKFRTPKEGSTGAPVVIDATNHMVVSYHDIVRATRNFSEGNLIGVGGFGKVFKGQLSNGLTGCNQSPELGIPASLKELRRRVPSTAPGVALQSDT